MEMMVWNIVLTAVVGVMGFLIKSKFDELSRLGILLNRTREEVARDHITRREVDDRVEKLVTHMDQRFNRIEQKLDDMQKGRTL
jgi:ABC-type Fe3+-hydroxamate transport system substrate-binding protein